MHTHVLSNTYKLLYKLKFIDKFPDNLMDIQNDFIILNNLHNFVYSLKRSNYSIEKQHGMLNNIGIFTDDQIKTILKKSIIMKGGGDDNSIDNNSNEMMDWLLFPLWKLENHEIYGPYFGIPIDFISVLLSSLDSVISTLLVAIDSIREPILQTAMSVFTVGTAGIGLAITPLLVPAINKTIDLIIHIISHMIDILNMFIHISRKNFGLAYILLLEIIPPLEALMEKAINYTVILNKSLKRGTKLMNTARLYIENLPIGEASSS
jgi:hypothetical protein